MTTPVLQDYLNLVTSAYQDKPDFIAALTAVLQPLVDQQALLATIPGLYDLDVAVGEQLDVVGVWVGRSRALREPLQNVYFSFDDALLGFDAGVWQGPYDPVSGLVNLPDDPYRNLLKAVIAANHWDGTIPSAYANWQQVFAGTGYVILIVDNEDMSMDIGVVGAVLDPITLALLRAGFLDLRPDGVLINFYFVPSVVGAPIFGFDISTPMIAGFDTGAWATLYAPT